LGSISIICARAFFMCPGYQSIIIVFLFQKVNKHQKINAKSLNGETERGREKPQP